MSMDILHRKAGAGDAVGKERWKSRLTLKLRRRQLIERLVVRGR